MLWIGSPLPARGRIESGRHRAWSADFSCEYLTELSEVQSLSRIQLFATPWTVAYQAPLSMGFSRVDCYFLLQGIFLTQGSNPSVVRLLRWYAHSLLCYLESPEKMMRRGNSKKEVPVFPGGANGKERVCQCRRHKRCEFDPWIRKIPWRKAWQPTPVFFPGESQGWQSLVGCRLWGRTESDTTEAT